MSRQKKLGLALLALAAAAALLAGVWYFNRPRGQAGEKAFTVAVVHKDGSTREFTYRTDAEMLGEVLEAEGLIEGTPGDFGLFITQVHGETADYSVDGGWWSLTRDGELTTTGIDQTPVADGDRFALTYTVG